jgi:hypothetical protein
MLCNVERRMDLAPVQLRQPWSVVAYPDSPADFDTAMLAAFHMLYVVHCIAFHMLRCTRCMAQAAQFMHPASRIFQVLLCTIL